MQWASFPLSSSHSVKETIDLTEKEEKIFRLLEVIRHFGLDTQLRVCGDWVRDKKPEQSKHLETGVRVYDTWIDFVDLRSEKYVNSWSPTMVELIFYGLNFWIDMFKVISMYAKAKGLSGTKLYFGDLGKTMKIAGSNALFAALTELLGNVLSGAETNDFNGMVTGFHQGILQI